MRRNNRILYEQIIKTISKQVKRSLNEDIQRFDTSDYQEDDNDIIDKHTIDRISNGKYYAAIENIKQLFKIFKPDNYDVNTDPEDGCTVNTKDGAEVFITRVVYDETNDKLDIYGAFTEADLYDEQNDYDSEEEMYYSIGDSLFDCSDFDLEGLDSLFFIVRNAIYWYRDDNMSDDEFYRITDNIG